MRGGSNLSGQYYYLRRPRRDRRAR